MCPARGVLRTLLCHALCIGLCPLQLALGQLAPDTGSVTAFGHRYSSHPPHPPPSPGPPQPPPPLPERTADAVAELQRAFASTSAAPRNGAADSVCEPSTSTDPCEYVTQNPACDFERVDYLRLHYCLAGRGAPAVLSVGIAVLWCTFLFFALSITADSFFAPAVRNIAAWLRLPSDVAGATLLALGNGGPDFFTQVAAITHGQAPDLALALGEGVGAGMFVCCVGLAMAVLVAPGGSVSASEGPFLRDAAAYLSALVLIALSFVDATVQGSESAFLLVAYALYVAVVCLGGNHAVPTVVDPICTQCPVEGVELTDRHGARSFGCERAARPTSPVSASGAERSVGHAVRRNAVQAVGQGEASPAEDGCDTVSGDLEAAERDDDAGGGVQQGGWLRCGMLVGPPADGPTGLGAQAQHWIVTYSGVADPSTARWSLPLTAPARMLNACTMADPDALLATRFHMVLIALSLPPFAALLLGLDTSSSSGRTSVWATRAALGALVLAVMPARGVVASKSRLLSLLAFIAGMCWMDLCADELVAVFQAIGRVFRLSESLLGGTVMCWAASAGDVAAAMAISRAGLPAMAIAACFAGPIFQLLLGTGVSLMYVSSSNGPVPVHVSRNLRLLFIFAFLVLAYFLLAVPVLHGGMLTRRFAFGVIAAYLAFALAFAIVGVEDP